MKAVDTIVFCMSVLRLCLWNYRFLFLTLLFSAGIQINHQIMQVNIFLMLQKSCQILLAFRAEDRIHGIRVPKLHIEKPDFFNRKCLSVQIQRIADTIIWLHRSCRFWLHSCRLFFSLHIPAANLLQRL